MVLGYMPMPANFRYMDVLQKGMPRHEGWDSFRIKHPPMSASRWAKIFSPFDALRGFNEAVAAKEVMYEFKRELDEGEKEELNRRLAIMQSLTHNGKTARQNKVVASITHDVPCADPDNFAYGYRGQYTTTTGIVWNVDTAVTHSLQVGDQRIRFSDIVAIKSSHQIYDPCYEEERGIFESAWEVDAP